jgi:hypothetical protein
MPGPIEKIGAKVIASQSEVKSGDGVSKFKDVQKNAMPKDTGVKSTAAPDSLPPLKEVTAAERRTIERDLRKRIEQEGPQDPLQTFWQRHGRRRDQRERDHHGRGDQQEACECFSRRLDDLLSALGGSVARPCR